MSAIAGAVDEAQDARAAELMAEQPKFVDATKNFLSMRMAEAMTAADDAEPDQLDAAAERFLADFARELADDASLAWAPDFKEAIRERQLARVDDAKARAAAGGPDGGGAGSNALRGAVADGLAAPHEETGTVITHVRDGEVLHEVEVKSCPGAGL